MTVEFERLERHSERQGAPLQQLKVRSGLRAGASSSTTADCSQGLQYWKQEYQYWKNYAKSIGCA